MSKATFDSLKLSDEKVRQLVDEHYGLTGEIKALTGEVDFNYKLTISSGEVYVLKISRPGTLKKDLAFQAAIFAHLARQKMDIQVPYSIPTKDGNWGTSFLDRNGQERWLRLQNWIEGREILKANPKSRLLLGRWGAACGMMAKAMQGFDHPEAHKDFRWDPVQVLATRPLIKFIKDIKKRALLEYYWELYEQRVLPVLPALRKSVNHNDGHERNVLVNRNYTEPKVVGIIDFGDAVYTATVNELAIAAAYASMEMPDPLQAACDVVAGFYQQFKLEEKELGVVFPLICARLVISVSYAAKNKEEESENEYLQVSDAPAWQLLQAFREVNPAFAEAKFRAACGLEPHPKGQVFNDWLKQEKPVFRNVIKVVGKRICFLDLSMGGEVLGNNAGFATQEAMDKTIFRYMEDQNAMLGIGGYLETRPLYTTDAYEIRGNEGPQWRTVHIGLDFWEKAGTPVYAPYDGIVHSFHDNAAERDYGPTIILEHKATEGLTFYTLYGHLSVDSLEGLSFGMAIKAGQEIAKIGPAPENGNWPPHLHFQVMLDMLGKVGDFPGVAFDHEIDVWKSICPDPKRLVPDLESVTVPVRKHDSQALLAKRKEILGRGLSISYKKHLHMVRGYGSYLYDITGRRYLDTVNNVAHVGHEHSRVVEAGRKQMALLNTNTRYLHEGVVDYAEKLLATFPEELCVVHFVNSGSEANELALRMIETIRGSREMIALEIGYHGNTGRTIDVSSYKFDGKAGKGAPGTTQVVPMPDVFRGLHRNVETAGKAYAAYIDQAIDQINTKGKVVGGFIAEPIMSCGGQIVLPEGYLKEAYAKVRATGGLCISDEVQVGFGRVGEAFWGFELHDVVPDIVTLGKPIGNGHPMGAVVCTQAVADAFANGMEFFSTFGGNPVSAAIGKAVLEVIEEEQLQDNAKSVGHFLKLGLEALQEKHPVIGDVRGQGLFLGFELVNNPEEKKVLPEVASYISNRMRQFGILTSTDGPQENVIKIKPPICFTERQASFFLGQLENILMEDFIKKRFD